MSYKGCWKPELPFYERILKALPYSPSSVFFLWMTLRKMSRERNERGLDAVVFESPDQLRLETPP